MNKVYGYCRISTAKQNIERQVRNILSFNPQAHIIKEVFTGTHFQGRVELDKMLKRIQAGDTIIFDSVSRMSRNAEEGFLLYEELFLKGINLIFLKEPHVNTETYKQTLDAKLKVQFQSGDQATDQLMQTIIQALNDYTLALAKKQIQLAFAQSEKEVFDLRQRTREGIETARRSGKQIGQKEGSILTTKKSLAAKEIIRKHSKTFGGSLSDIELMKQCSIARNTLYKYKRELKREMEETGI